MMEIHKVMQARVKKVALPEPKLPPTYEYRGSPKQPESWEAQRAARKRIAEAKRKKHTRKGFHAWTDAERKELIAAREVGKSWTEIAAEYGVTVTAAQTQMWRGRKAGL